MRLRKLTSISVISAVLVAAVGAFSTPALSRERLLNRDPIVGAFDMDAIYGIPPTFAAGTAVFHSDGTFGWYGSGIGSGIGAGAWHNAGKRWYIFTFVNISAMGRGVLRAKGWLSRDGERYGATTEFEVLDRDRNRVTLQLGTATGTRLRAEGPSTAPPSFDGAEHEAIANAAGHAFLVQRWLEQVAQQQTGSSPAAPAP